MRVLITGGAGFIGSNLARRLVDEDHSLVILDDFSTGQRDNLTGLDVEVIEASILSEALDAAAAGADVVVHLGARPSVPRSIADPVTTHRVNVDGTVAVLEAARKNDAQVIFASSSSVYGQNRTLPKVESMRPDPISPYAVSKLAGEAYVLSYGRCYDLPVVPFRFFNVYGPHQAPDHVYAAVVPNFVSAALRGQPLTIHGDGLQTRDFTFIDTVTDAIAKAISTRARADDPVNLAFGTRISLLGLASKLGKIIGRDLPMNHVDPRAGDVRDSCADNAKLTALLPDLSPTPLDVGLAATVTWMEGHLEQRQP